MTWSLRGIDEEARERALDEARRSGLSLDEWLNALILERRAAAPAPVPAPAAEPPAAEPAAPAPAPAAAVATGLERRLQELNERLHKLSAAALPGRARAARTDESEAVADAMHRLIAEREAGRAAESPPVPAPVPSRPGPSGADPIEALSRLERRPRGATLPPPPRHHADGPAAPRAGTSSDRLQKALAEIVARRTALAEERTPERPLPEPAPVAPPAPVAAAVPAPAAPAEPAPAAPAPVPAAPTLPSLADFEQHFRALAARIDALAAARQPDPAEALTAEVRALRRAVETERGADAADEAAFRALAERIDALAQREPDRSLIDPLVLEIARLRDAVAASADDDALRSLEAGYGHVVERLEDLRRRLPEPAAFDQVLGDVGDIRDQLRLLPGSGQVARLGQALDAIAARLDDLAARPDDAATAALAAELAEIRRAVDGFDPAELARLFDRRLDEVVARIDAAERAALGPIAPDRLAGLIEEVRRVAAGSSIVEALGALGERTDLIAERLAAIEAARAAGTAEIAAGIAALADRLDRLDGRAPDPDHIADLQDGIAALMRRLDQGVALQDEPDRWAAIEALLRRVDTQLAQQTPAGRLDVLEAFEARVTRIVEKLDRIEPRQAGGPDTAAVLREIAGLRADLAQVPAARDEAGLPARLDALGSQLEALGRAPDERALVLIEDQLARIGRQIEGAESRFAGLGAIEDTLAGIHRLLTERRDEPLAAARAAAREALIDFAGVARDQGTAAVVEALRDEMRELQAGLYEHEAAAAATLRSVHEALTAVVQRLGAVEQRAVQAGAAVHPAASAAPAASPAADPLAALRAAGTPRPEPRAEVEDTRPLEPGSGKPFGRGVRGPDPAARPGAAREDTPPAATKKADFIAAARRAAMAAQQAETLPTEAPPAPDGTGDDDGPDGLDGRPGPLARIGAALRNRRRPLMVAAAVLLAAFALQIVTGEHGRDADLAEAPAAAPERVAAPGPAAEPALTAPTQSATAALSPPSGPSAGFAEAPAGPPSGGFAQPSATASSAPPVAAPSVAAPARIAAAPPGIAADPVVTGALPKAAEPPGPLPKAAEPAGSLPERIGSPALRKAALAGDPRAAFEIGLRYAEGRGVPADPAEASRWYARAAEAGLAPAQYRLASAYEKGHAGQRDPAAAKRWYLSAAEKGNVRAMHNLGVLYANDRDMARAVPWFTRAAEAGLRDSQFNLGIVHALGSGAKQDLAVSYKWFALAAAQGDKDAEKKRDDIAAHLDKTMLAAARMAVDTFRPKPVDRAANDETGPWAEPDGAPTAATGAGLVQTVQGLLQARGLYGGPLTGTLDERTRQAVRTAQRKLNLKPTGEPDEALVHALQANPT